MHTLSMYAYTQALQLHRAPFVPGLSAGFLVQWCCSAAARAVVTCRLDSEEVVLAAMWDLLTMQCDRHGQNVHLDENAKLTLIDLDQALGDAWRICGFDSIFLPTTQKHAIMMLGFSWAMKMPPDQLRRCPPTDHFGIMHALDYRCHAPGGKIGKSYPPRMQQCLENISTSTYRQVAVCSVAVHAPLQGCWAILYRAASATSLCASGSRSFWVREDVQGCALAPASVRHAAQRF